MFNLEGGGGGVGVKALDRPLKSAFFCVASLNSNFKCENDYLYKYDNILT